VTEIDAIESSSTPNDNMALDVKMESVKEHQKEISSLNDEDG